MSELISGKEAFDAAYNDDGAQWRWTGKEVEWRDLKGETAFSINELKGGACEFRLKPRTIKINNIEVPAPFEPKEGEACCFISDESVDGYHTISYNSKRYSGVIFGLYRPSDIERVVAALRSIFSNK